MQSTPTVSIVIVNKDDARITETLTRLQEIDHRSLVETIVVDASEGRLDAVRERFESVTWINYSHPEGKPRTIAEQRNLGVHAAIGDVVVFLDANCVPAAGWLPALLAPLAEGSQDIVTGSVIARGASTVHEDENALRAVDANYLTECSNMNVAFRRSVFGVVGDFDEKLGFAEDIDFSWRAVDAGYRIFYVAEAEVSHDWGDRNEDLSRAFRYGIARVRLLRKHRSRIKSLAGKDRYVIIYALFVLFSPLVFVYPAYLLLLAYPLIRNRHRKPVDVVVYQLVYAAGVLSELFRIPLFKRQRNISTPRRRG